MDLMWYETLLQLEFKSKHIPSRKNSQQVMAHEDVKQQACISNVSI